MIISRHKERNPMILSGLTSKLGAYAEIAFIALLMFVSYFLSMVLFK
jgi:hypothetical protein